MPNLKTEPASEVAVYDLSQEAEQRIRDLEQELQFTKENLQATIEELETSNEELQATNEELLASNEELQSTNEELQSVNEELHTVNTEYQTKILELTEMTNDLENLMAATELATLFLDENLNIRKFTPELTRIFRIIASDVGRPFVHLTHTLVGEDPLNYVSEVARTGQRLSKPVLTRAGESYLMQVMPYQVGGNTPSGILLTFIDIASLQAARLELREANALLSSTRRLTAACSWRLNPETGAMVWSSGAGATLGVADDRLPRDHEQFLALIHPDDRDGYEVGRRASTGQGQPGDFVFRVLQPDGTVRVIHELSSSIDDDADRQIALLGILHDITEQPELLCASCPRIEPVGAPLPKPGGKPRRKAAGRT
jgi:two-component system CheB/CheR fusion protein